MKTLESNPLVLDPYSFPVLLPQITCVGGEVYSGTCGIAQVTQSESDFLAACTGALNLTDAARSTRIEPTSIARLATWLLWWRRKVTQDPPLLTPIARLVLTAAHTSAWLGMGGRLVLESTQQPAVMVTCFGALGEVRFVEMVSSLSEAWMICRDEATLAGRLAGVQQRVLDLPDHAFCELLLETGRSSGEARRGLLRNALLDIIDEYQPLEIFAPAALGSSGDSRLLFEILVSLFAEGYVPGELHFFEDEPATNGHRAVDEFLSRFEKSYLAPNEYFVDITNSFAEKLSLMEAFQSTLYRTQRRSWARSAERNAMIGEIRAERAERFWQLTIASLEG
jgi:LmbE family N-acetylglucosaminyl deacetylase